MAVMVKVVAVAGDAVRSLEDIKQQLEEFKAAQLPSVEVTLETTLLVYVQGALD